MPVATQAIGEGPVAVPAQLTTDDIHSSAQLLGLAARAAAKLPTKPHEENRTRLQAEIVDAALAANQLDVARRLVPGISDWRRALAQASIAAHLAKSGDAPAAKKELAAAVELAATITGEREQGWRLDRVRGKIAETYARLGDASAAATIQAKLGDDEAAKLAPLSVTTTKLDDETVDGQVATLVEIAKTASLEPAYGVLSALATLYGRFDGNAVRRESLEGHIRESWHRVPIALRIEVLKQLVEHDLNRGDLVHATKLTEETVGLITGNTWNPEQAVALRGEGATMLFRIGEKQAAKETLQGALALYDSSMTEVAEIFHGRAIRPLAEAFSAIGETNTADELYMRGLAKIMVNPNGRPRVNDLVGTLISLSAAGHEPSEELMRLVERMETELKAPW